MVINPQCTWLAGGCTVVGLQGEMRDARARERGASAWRARSYVGTKCQRWYPLRSTLFNLRAWCKSCTERLALALKRSLNYLRGVKRPARFRLVERLCCYLRTRHAGAITPERGGSVRTRHFVIGAAARGALRRSHGMRDNSTQTARNAAGQARI